MVATRIDHYQIDILPRRRVPRRRAGQYATAFPRFAQTSRVRLRPLVMSGAEKASRAVRTPRAPRRLPRDVRVPADEARVTWALRG